MITRARFIKNALENAGYRLVPWDFKKQQPPTFWEERDRTMEEEDDDLYGPAETAAAPATKEEEKSGSGSEQGDEPMDEGLESGDDEDEDSDSVCCCRALTQAIVKLTYCRTSKSSSTSHRQLQSPRRTSPFYSSELYKQVHLTYPLTDNPKNPKP